jgi:hypothetical protein
MSFENVNPKDVVTIVTKDGELLKADVVGIKRDRVQLRIIGPWLTERQIKDARRSVKFANVATVKRDGRKTDAPPKPMTPQVSAIAVPSYVMDFIKSLRS